MKICGSWVKIKPLKVMFRDLRTAMINQRINKIL